MNNFYKKLKGGGYLTNFFIQFKKYKSNLDVSSYFRGKNG